METVRENDFVELEYTGKVAGSGEIFDTTSAETAKGSGIFDSKTEYSPVTICVGKRHLLAGLDRQLVGKEPGKGYTLKVPTEEAFGKKNAKLIQLISTSKFREQQLAPFPGMQVNIDGIVGTVRTVTGGRTIVDFNHPLAGKDIEYAVTVRRVVSDLAEKVNAVLRLVGLSPKSIGVSVADGIATLTFPKEAPEELKKDLGEKLKSTISDLKAVHFAVQAPEKKEEKKQ